MHNVRKMILASALVAFLGIALPAAAKGKSKCKPAPAQADVGVDIAFSLDLGDTVTDADGTHFYYFGIEEHDYSRVYVPEYWGTFPLYFFGSNVGVTVTVTNNESENLKLQVTNEAYVLNTDGTNGPELTDPRMVEVDLAPGESSAIDASFIMAFQPEFERGLNRFLVKVAQVQSSTAKGNGYGHHKHRGKGHYKDRGKGHHKHHGESEPVTILVKEGIFCPLFEPAGDSPSDGTEEFLGEVVAEELLENVESITDDEFDLLEALISNME